MTGAGAGANAFGTGGEANGAVVRTAEAEALLRAVAEANDAVVPERVAVQEGSAERTDGAASTRGGAGANASGTGGVAN